MIFRFTLKRQQKAILIWTAVVVAVFYGLLAGIFPYYKESTEMFQKVIEGFPKGFGAAFGLDLKTVFSFGGFYNFAFTYVSLLGAVFALYLGISIFSEEKRFKCAEFLYAHPISRTAVFRQKWLAGLTGLMIQFLPYLAVNLLMAKIFAEEEGVTMARLGSAAVTLLLTELVFYGWGVLVGIAAHKIRSAGGTATMLGLISFVITAVINILDSDLLRHFAVLKFFEPYSVFRGEGLSLTYAPAAVLMFLLCLITSVLLIRRDVE